MKALWLDTGPILELVAYHLGKPGASRADANASRQLRTKIIVLTSRARVNAFEDRVQSDQFGEVKFSSGSLVELYNHIRGPLHDKGGALDLVDAFWDALSSLGAALRRPLRCVPMPREGMDPRILTSLGPVDAHLLAELQADKTSWLFTTDNTLMRAASDRSQERVFQLRG